MRIIFDGVFNRTVSANLGMSYSVSNVLAEAGTDVEEACAAYGRSTRRPSRCWPSPWRSRATAHSAR